MCFAGHDDDAARRCLFARDVVPLGLAGDSRALPDRQGMQAAVAAEDAAVGRHKVAWLTDDVLIEEAGKGVRATASFADEAQAHALVLVAGRQLEGARDATYVGFAELAEGEEAACEARRRDGRQEERLVLRGVDGALHDREGRRALVARAYPSIVARGEPGRLDGVEQRAKLDRAIARHVRIRRRAVRPLLERRLKHVDPVVAREIDHVDVHAEVPCDGLDVVPLFLPRTSHDAATAALHTSHLVGRRPVAHVHASHVVVALCEQGRYDGRVDAARHGHGDAVAAPWRRPGPQRWPPKQHVAKRQRGAVVSRDNNTARRASCRRGAWDVDDMQAAPARRFHEAGLGSRTGLRIGSVRLDEQGQEDLDAFFAESKRVLEWMEGSEDDAEAPSEAGSDAWHRAAPQMAAESLEARPSLAPRADESLWNSTVDISRAERTFRLASSSPVPVDPALPSTSTPVVVPRGSLSQVSMSRGSESRASPMDVSLPATDASWARPAASRLPETDVSFLRPEASRLPETDVSFLRPEASRLSVSEASFGRTEASRLSLSEASFLRPEASRLSLSEASFVRPEASRLSVSEASFVRPDASRLPETDVSFLRPEASRLSTSEASFVRPEASRLSVSEASELAPPTWDDAPASDPPSEPMEALDAIDEDEPAPVPIKRGRGRPRKDASMPPLRGRPGRPPGRQKPAQRIVERILDPPAWQLENPEGLRRGKRHRIAPLDWWRGERALYGKPDEPTGDALTGVVAPVLKQVIRVPRAPGEGTFSGMRRFRAKPAGYAQPGRPPGSRNYVPRLSPVEEDEDDDEEEAAAWEADTDPYGRVMDADTNTEVTMRIACTAAGIRPRPAFNQAFSYEKIFGISDFMAAGVLVIPEGGEKPAKPSKDNNYTFVVLRGVVQVMVHRTRFVIAAGGMFLVPKGNTYHIRNVSQREVRLFFAQARLLTDAPHMTHVVREGRTAFAHGPERVRVEEEEGDEEEDDDDEAASEGASEGASEADASGDYIDPT